MTSRRRLQCWVDRKTCIVTRYRRRKAIALGYVAFAVFDALHNATNNRLLTNTLLDRVYSGASDPGSKESLNAVIYIANKKLAHIGLKICGVNRKQNSFYQLVVLT